MSREEHSDIQIAQLLSAFEGITTYCDSCEMNGNHKKTAKTACLQCEKVYCAKHSEVGNMYSDRLKPKLHYFCAYTNDKWFWCTVTYWVYHVTTFYVLTCV